MSGDQKKMEFLQKSIHPLLESLTYDLITQQPQNIVQFIQKWMVDNGYNFQTPQPETGYSKIYSKSQQYIKLKVSTLLEELVTDLLVKEPSDIPKFIIEWLNIFGTKYANVGQRISLGELKDIKKNEKENSEDEVEEDDEIDEEQLFRKKNKNQNRQGISSEVYGSHNKKGNFKPRKIEKTQEQRDRIMKRLSQSFMFSSLDPEETEIISMEEKKLLKGNAVIKQGQEGKELFVVDSGELDCYRTIISGEQPTYLKTYVAGESFGELALLYNAPRAASVYVTVSYYIYFLFFALQIIILQFRKLFTYTKTDCVLWCLDRDTFNHIVKDSSMKKREKFEKFVSSIDILKQMSAYERLQLIDALIPVNTTKDSYVQRKIFYQPSIFLILNLKFIETYVFEQGAEGDFFYMIEQGELVAIKDEKEVLKYKPGEYFGELALMNDKPRAASIKCLTDCSLVCLDRASFSRLLGPLEEILKRNQTTYSQYVL